MSRHSFLGPVFFMTLAFTGSALAASSEAFNKTVTMSWSTSGMATTEDGQQRAYNNLNIRTVYISSAGRTFLRRTVRGQKASRSGERGPGEASKGSVSLQGNRLVGTEAFASGARQYIATFDPGFTSCTLQVIDAKSGDAAIKRKGPDGRMYTVTATTGSPSCSVQSGNAFGGGE
ncbi:MAG: hypothetical protein J0I29_01520 [Rhizobiales bacterium]|nr:hypothetical protein [Hyphomicrobiales bacterium]